MNEHIYKNKKKSSNEEPCGLAAGFFIGDFADIVTYPPSIYRGIVALQIKNHPEIIPYLMEGLKNYLSANPETSHDAGKLLLIEVHRVSPSSAV